MQTLSRCALTLLCLMTFAPGTVRAQATLAGIDARISTREGEAERASTERQRVDAEIEGLVEQRAAAQRRLRSRVHALYRMRRAGLLPLAGGFDALLRHQSRVERLERMVGRDVTSLRTLRLRVGALQGETSRLAGEAERAQQEVSSLREQRGVIERASLGAWAARAPSTEGPTSGFGVRVLEGAPLTPSFAQLRGRLPLPVGGTARLMEAEREGGVGLDVVATPGIHVRSVAAGRIAYAAPHPSYGRLVIVDHDDGFYTVYGGLGGLSTEVGRSVEPGGVIGTSGVQPVFFQVRRGTRPMPAREWLGL